jgi:integrase
MSGGHIRQRSPGSWELRYRVGSKTCTVTHRGTKKEAAARLRELMTAADRGEHVAPSRTTVGEFVRDRIALWSAAGRISPRTTERYGELLELYIAQHLGSIPLQKLGTVAVETWHTTLRASGRKDGKGGLCARTVRHAHRLLLQTLDEAARHKLVARNVCREQKPPKSADSEVEIIAQDQVAPMLANLEADPFYVPVVVGLYCGMRRGEQLALRWGNVDLDAKVLRIREAIEETRAGGIRIKVPKTSAGRRDISLPVVVVDALRNHRRQQLERRLLLGLGKMPNDALVFPADAGGYQSPRAFSTRWAYTVRRLGLPKVTWHALRHTHASMLIAAGVDIVTISKRLGHAKPDITLRVYSHLFNRTDEAAAAAINAALG